MRCVIIMKFIRKIMSMVLGVTVAFMVISLDQDAKAEGVQTVKMDKSVYLYGQPINLSFTGASKKDWIGLYKKGTIPQGSNPSLTWQYTSASTQPVGNLSYTKALAAGEYEALYMENDGYNIFQRAPFSIISLNAPMEITFVDTDEDADQIAGELKIKSPVDQTNVTNYRLYWGNDIGKLSDQPFIAVLPPTVTGGTYASYMIADNTVIPNGATKLLAYSDSVAGETTTGAEVTIPGIEKEKPAVSFEVITDMHVQGDKNHVHNKNFEDALKDMVALNPDSDGLMTIGDNTENGTEAQFKELGRIFNLYKDQLPEAYFVQGNHDVRWGDWTQFSELFAKYTNMTSSYYNAWINGYQFIFIGTEKGLKDYSYLSETQLKWLDEKLSESQGKPTFIFHHQPLKNTVSGANDGYLKSNYWYGVRQDKELKMILAKHPQSILFSGHTHWDLGSKDTMYNAKYATMFNAGATSYLWTDSNTSKDGSQGFFVEVYDDKVLVKGRDFKNDTWIANAQYEVDLSEQIPVVDPATDPDLTLSNPTIQLVKETYLPQDAVQVAYTSSVNEDWIGIFPVGTNLGKNVQAIAKQKTNSVKQPDGTMSFSGLNLAPGKYDAIYVGEAEYRTDNDNLELGRVTFEIVEESHVPSLEEQMRQANKEASQSIFLAKDKNTVEQQVSDIIEQLSVLINSDKLTQLTELDLITDTTNTVFGAMMSKWEQGVIDEQEVLEQTDALLTEAFLPTFETIGKSDLEEWETAVATVANVNDVVIAKLGTNDISDKWIKKLGNTFSVMLVKLGSTETSVNDVENLTDEINRFATAVEIMETSLDNKASLFKLEKTFQIEMDRNQVALTSKHSIQDNKSFVTLSSEIVQALSKKQLNLAVTRREDAGVWLSERMLQEHANEKLTIFLSKIDEIKLPKNLTNMSGVYKFGLEAGTENISQFDSGDVRIMLPYEYKAKYLFAYQYDERHKSWKMVTSSKGKAVEVMKTDSRVSFGTKKAGIFLVANADVQSISVTPKRTTLLPGETLQLAVTGKLSDRSEQDLTSSVSGTVYESSNKEITIDENGMIQVSDAVNAGTRATIMVKNGEKSMKMTVTVAQIKSIEIAAKKKSVKAGDMLQFTVTATMTDRNERDITKEKAGTTYTIKEAGYADISKDGLLKVKEKTPAGTTLTVVAKHNGYQSEYRIKVKK